MYKFELRSVPIKSHHIYILHCIIHNSTNTSHKAASQTLPKPCTTCQGHSFRASPGKQDQSISFHVLTVSEWFSPGGFICVILNSENFAVIESTRLNITKLSFSFILFFFCVLYIWKWYICQTVNFPMGLTLLYE